MSKFINRPKTQIKLDVLTCYSPYVTLNYIMFVGGSNNKIINTVIVDRYNIGDNCYNNMYNYISIYNSEINIYFDAMRSVNINNSKMHKDFNLLRWKPYPSMTNLNVDASQHINSYLNQYIDAQSSIYYDQILMKVKLS